MMTRRTFGRQALTLGAGMLLRHDTWAQAVGNAAFTGAGSLKAHALLRGRFAGAAVNMGLLATNELYARTIAEQYNVVVAENAMKWAPLRPAPDTFRFDEADRFMAFAEVHKMSVRGHNLCWHRQLPLWFAATVTGANAGQYLATHIATVAGRYRERMRSWDVVNEAIDPKDGQPQGLRNSPWYKLLGPEYIDIAFHAAREADPHALLTYNDYGIETDSPEDTAKRGAVLALLKRMQHSRVPLDAVGIQSHISAGSAKQIGNGLPAFVQECSEMNLKVFVTEMDVNDDSLAIPDVKARGAEVAAIYGDYLKVLLANPAVTDVLTWGVNSGASWLNGADSEGKFRPKHPDREEICLPFDDGFQPNAAFHALRDALDAGRS